VTVFVQCLPGTFDQTVLVHLRVERHAHEPSRLAHDDDVAIDVHQSLALEHGRATSASGRIDGHDAARREPLGRVEAQLATHLDASALDQRAGFGPGQVVHQLAHDRRQRRLVPCLADHRAAGLIHDGLVPRVERSLNG
jgi:hypothetical protein